MPDPIGYSSPTLLSLSLLEFSRALSREHNWSVPFFVCARCYQISGVSQHLMRLSLGICSVFSKHHKTVSLATSGSFLPLEVFSPKTVLSATMGLSV